LEERARERSRQKGGGQKGGSFGDLKFGFRFPHPSRCETYRAKKRLVVRAKRFSASATVSLAALRLAGAGDARDVRLNAIKYANVHPVTVEAARGNRMIPRNGNIMKISYLRVTLASVSGTLLQSHECGILEFSIECGLEYRS